MPEQIPLSDIEPVFDPQNVGTSLMAIQEQLPLHSPWLHGSVVGEVASRRRGHGYDADGLRDYEYGDDPRHIDWPATARSTDGMPKVRERYADITPSLFIITDMLSEHHQQTPGYFSEQILALSAISALLRLAYVNGMPSAVQASNGRRVVVRQEQPAQGTGHILKTAQRLAAATSNPAKPKSKWRREQLALPERPEVYLGDMLHYAAARCAESVVAVVSDFRDVADPQDEHGWQEGLRRLARNRNELLAIELTNPDDTRLPDGVARILTYDEVRWIGKEERAQYALAAAKQQAAIDTVHDAVKAHHVQLSTAEPKWLSSLRRQLRHKI